MPAFVDALTPEQRWAITDYIVSLSGTGEPGYTNLVIAKHVQNPIDLAQGAASFESARVARFPIIGQIMEPGRAFHPSTSSVTVQAIYDAESIAVLVRWHDMSAQKEGKNSPSLSVPPAEEEQAPEGRATEGAQDPFADPAAGGGRHAIRVLRRRRDPDSIAGARRRPQAVLHLRRRSELGRSLVLRSRPARAPLSSSVREARDVAPSNASELTGVASYDQGEWSVIFKRPLRPKSGAAFSPGEFLPMGFSVWDGFSRERGNRRGLSVWYSLYVEPQNVPSAVGPMLRTALFILAIELVLIGWVRYAARRRHEIGGKQGQQPATSV